MTDLSKRLADARPKLDGLLFYMLGSDDLVKLWWNKPNRAFDGQTPDVMFALHPARVINYVCDQYQG
jgi:hypothetical protein